MVGLCWDSLRESGGCCVGVESGEQKVSSTIKISSIECNNAFLNLTSRLVLPTVAPCC